MDFAARSVAAFDAYVGLEVDLPSGRRVVLPALRLADALRFARVAERASAGDEAAALAVLHDFPRAVGLDPEDTPPEDVFHVLDRCFDAQRYAPESPESPESSAGEEQATRPNWDDLVADYANAYGRPPGPDMPWPLFLALAQRADRYEARARLRQLIATSLAIGAAFSGDNYAVQDEIRRLAELAYPFAVGEDGMIENLASRYNYPQEMEGAQ